MTFVRHFLTITTSMDIIKRRTVKTTFIRKVISLLWRKVCEVFAKNTNAKCVIIIKWFVIDSQRFMLPCYTNTFSFSIVVKHLQRIVYISKQQAACQSCLIRLDLKPAEKMKVKLYADFCTKMLNHYAQIKIFHLAFCFNCLVS